MKKRNLKRRRLLSEGGLYRSRVDLFSTFDEIGDVDEFIEEEIRGNEDQYSWAFDDYEDGLTVDEMEIDRRAIENYLNDDQRDNFHILIDDLSDEVERVLPRYYSIIVKGNFRRWDGSSNRSIKVFDDINEALNEIVRSYDDVDFYIQDNVLCVDGHHHDATDTCEIYVYDEPSVKRWFKENGDEEVYDLDDLDWVTVDDFVDVLRNRDIGVDEFVDVACKGFGSKLLKTYKFRYTNRKNRR